MKFSKKKSSNVGVGPSDFLVRTVGCVFLWKSDDFLEWIVGFSWKGCQLFLQFFGKSWQLFQGNFTVFWRKSAGLYRRIWWFFVEESDNFCRGVWQFLWEHLKIGGPEILIFSPETVFPEKKISGGVFYPNSPENSPEMELRWTSLKRSHIAALQKKHAANASSNSLCCKM